MLLSPNNLLKPSDGGPVAVPSQDMVLGIYYLTMGKMIDRTNEVDLDTVAEKNYADKEEVRKAVEAEAVSYTHLFR